MAAAGWIIVQMKFFVGLIGSLSWVLPVKYVWMCHWLTQQEPIETRRQMAMGNQVIDIRGRKFTKRVVDIRELNEQAKVIDDLK